MNTPQKQADSVPAGTTRSNRRWLVILLVVIFVALISFFAGRHSERKPFINQETISGDASDPSGKDGVPPDSLHH